MANRIPSSREKQCIIQWFGSQDERRKQAGNFDTKNALSHQIVGETLSFKGMRASAAIFDEALGVPILPKEVGLQHAYALTLPSSAARGLADKSSKVYSDRPDTTDLILYGHSTWRRFIAASRPTQTWLDSSGLSQTGQLNTTRGISIASHYFSPEAIADYVHSIFGSTHGQGNSKTLLRIWLLSCHTSALDMDATTAAGVINFSYLEHFVEALRTGKGWKSFVVVGFDKAVNYTKGLDHVRRYASMHEIDDSGQFPQINKLTTKSGDLALAHSPRALMVDHAGLLFSE